MTRPVRTQLDFGVNRHVQLWQVVLGFGRRLNESTQLPRPGSGQSRSLWGRGGSLRPDGFPVLSEFTARSLIPPVRTAAASLVPRVNLTLPVTSHESRPAARECRTEAQAATEPAAMTLGNHGITV